MKASSQEIVLVEDNEMHAELFLRHFSKLSNQKVRWCRNSLQVKQYFQTHMEQQGRVHPQFTIVDIKLPDEDGLSLISFLKDKYRKSPHEIIVFTSSFDEEEAAKAQELGVGLFVTKPVLSGGYSEAVSQILDFTKKAFLAR